MFHGWQHLTDADRENILRGIAEGKVYGGPYHLELDWVDRCNANCFFCNSEYIHNGPSIPWDQAQRHLEGAIAGGLRSVRLCGGGEPTLHPHFVNLLGFLGRNNVILDNLTTNGQLLSDRVIDAMMQVNVQEVRVSLNYATPATYAEGMGLTEKAFAHVVENTRKLSLARQGSPRFGRLMLQFFIYRPTMHLIRASYELARELGADLVTYRELWNIKPELYYTQEEMPQVADAMAEIIREDWSQGIVECHLESHGIGKRIRKTYEDLERELGGRPQFAPETFNESTRYCYIGWYSMTLLGSQAVYPCCYLIPNQVLPPIGNLTQQTLPELWRGESYTRFRKEMRDFFLLQRQVPLFDRRVKKIDRGCASHTSCPITRSMCDEAFYEEADRRLEAVRRRPGVQLWRLANRVGRRLERQFRKP